MLVYILPIMACVWRGRRNGEGERKLSDKERNLKIFKREKSQTKSIKIIKEIEDKTVDVNKFSIVDKIDKIRQKSQNQKGKAKLKKSNISSLSF
jgi:hypothetical protein